jgi:hypothetical protein
MTISINYENLTPGKLYRIMSMASDSLEIEFETANSWTSIQGGNEIVAMFITKFDNPKVYYGTRLRFLWEGRTISIAANEAFITWPGTVNKRNLVRP